MAYFPVSPASGRIVVHDGRSLPPAYAPPPVAPPPQFVDTLEQLWRHRKMILLCAVAVAAIAGAVSLALPSRYIAEAQVLVAVPSQAPNIFNGAGAQAPGGGGANDDALVDNEKYVLLSRQLASQVIDQLDLSANREFNPALEANSGFGSRLSAWFNGLESHLLPGHAPAPTQASLTPSKDRMIDTLLSKLTVTALGRSNVLAVDAETQSPQTSQSIANTVVSDYLNSARGSKIQDMNRIDQYMDGRIADLRNQVEQSEQTVEAYRKQYGLYGDLNNKANNVASQQLTELNTNMVAAQTAMAEAQARLQDASAGGRGGANDSNPDVLNSPLIQNLKAQQAQAEQNLAQLTATYGPRHPDVINARAQIQDMSRKIQAEMNSTVAGLKHQADAASARYAAMQRDFNAAETKMGGANQYAIHLETLERDATVNRNLLADLLTRTKEMSLQTAVEQPDAKIISQAALADAVSFPPRKLFVLIGAIGGALIGIMLAFLRDSADRTFRRYEDVEAATGLPVMAMVPNQRRVSPVLHVLKRPVSPFSEALRRVYVGLQMLDGANPTKTVLMSSAVPAEGKSVLVASLGRLLASNGKRVLLIDCDWRAPNLHRLLRMPNKAGLADMLRGDTVALEDCIQHDTLSGLDVIPAGRWDGTDVTMLIAERMRSFLSTFAKNYDLVLIDAAPVLVGAEVLMLSRMVDKTLFAIRWGETRRELVQEALRQLVDAQVEVAGAVMTRVDPRRYRQYAYGPLNYEYARPVAGHLT